MSVAVAFPGRGEKVKFLPCGKSEVVRADSEVRAGTSEVFAFGKSKGRFSLFAKIGFIIKEASAHHSLPRWGKVDA